MTKARWLTVVAALSAAVALAGCTEQSAGSPLPDDMATTGDEPDATEPTTSAEPSSERPREIKLDGKDPCALIPQADWPMFGIERPGRPSEDPNFGWPQCNYSRVGDVTLVVTEGVEAWEERTQNVEINGADAIEGFSTVTIWNKVDRRSCYGVVDVADGQYLLTTAAPNPNDPEQPKACDLAYQLAESAMKTLVAS